MMWTVAFQAPLSMGFPRQEYWSGLPFAPPGDFPHPGIKLGSPPLHMDSSQSEPPGKTVYFYDYENTYFIVMSSINFFLFVIKA